MVAKLLDTHALGLDVVVSLGALECFFGFGQHIQRNQVRATIVVEIGRIVPHRKSTAVTKIISQ